MPETTTNIFEKAYDNLQTIGRTWATAALNSTSESLKATASFLSGLSQKLEVAEPEPPAEQTEADVETPKA